jgi:hypothetical protein
MTAYSQRGTVVIRLNRVQRDFAFGAEGPVADADENPSGNEVPGPAD